MKRVLIEDAKELMHPKSFGTLEKQAPDLDFIRSELHIVINEKTIKGNLKIGAANELTIKTNTYFSGDT